MFSQPKRPSTVRKYLPLLVVLGVVAAAVTIGALTYRVNRPASLIPPILPDPGTGNDTEGGGNAPPGQLALGTPNPFTVSAGGVAEGGCSVPTARTTHYCYSRGIISSGPGVSTSDLVFRLVTPSNAFIAVGSVTLQDLRGNGIAIYTPSQGWTGCTVPTCSTVSSSAGVPVTLSSTQTLVLYAGTSSVSGDTLDALFVGSFSGEQPVPLP